MQIKGMGMPRSRYLERGAAELSRAAQKRLAWFDYYQAHGRKAALTGGYFGLSRAAFSRRKRGGWRPPKGRRGERGRGAAGRPGPVRNPADYAVEKPGDLVQLDTLD